MSKKELITDKTLMERLDSLPQLVRSAYFDEIDCDSSTYNKKFEDNSAMLLTMFFLGFDLSRELDNPEVGNLRKLLEQEKKFSKEENRKAVMFHEEKEKAQEVVRQLNKSITDLQNKNSYMEREIGELEMRNGKLVDAFSPVVKELLIKED